MLSLLLATLSVGAPVNQTGGLGVINGRVTTAGNSHAEWQRNTAAFYPRQEVVYLFWK